MLEQLREEVWRANMALPANNLVTWTSGNVSGREPETGLVVIKPSGVLFDELTPDNMVIVDLAGNVVEATLGPSTDTASHLSIYRHRPDVNGVTHTHSNYATAFAAVGKSIPVYLTAIADEFGTTIPCAPYVRIGDQDEATRRLHHRRLGQEGAEGRGDGRRHRPDGLAGDADRPGGRAAGGRDCCQLRPLPEPLRHLRRKYDRLIPIPFK
jgi:ribulose-5-phosphate 4-epimerase/fuculose-1-phosphate aldolase